MGSVLVNPGAAGCPHFPFPAQMPPGDAALLSKAPLAWGWCPGAFAQDPSRPWETTRVCSVPCGQNHFPCGTGLDSMDCRARLQFPNHKDTWAGEDESLGNISTIRKLRMTLVCLGFFGLRFSKAVYWPGRKQLFPSQQNSWDTGKSSVPKETWKIKCCENRNWEYKDTNSWGSSSALFSFISTLKGKANQGGFFNQTHFHWEPKHRNKPVTIYKFILAQEYWRIPSVETKNPLWTFTLWRKLPWGGGGRKKEKTQKIMC